jgi:hypothetical protein
MTNPLTEAERERLARIAQETEDERLVRMTREKANGRVTDFVGRSVDDLAKLAETLKGETREQLAERIDRYSICLGLLYGRDLDLDGYRAELARVRKAVVEPR